MNKTVVIIDAGGRGAALVDAYSKSPEVERIIAIPGNDLMQYVTEKPVDIYTHLKTTSVTEILEICKKENVDLVDVAQDNAVAVGLVNTLQENGFTVFGPTKEAGQIEWDKGWARNFMKKYDIPTPLYKVCNSPEEGIAFINLQTSSSHPHPSGEEGVTNHRWFIKASGLAEGKGAIPAENQEEALKAIAEMEKFGDAGKTFVIEEWLEGEEFSYFAISDGKTFQIIGAAQDHKRVNDGDEGPNTGGMGCSTPPLVLTESLNKQAIEIIKKTIDGLAKEGKPYKGILYLGGIVSPISPSPSREKIGDEGYMLSVIEFNARWGDPEAEVLIPGIQNDMYTLAMAVINQTLHEVTLQTDGRARVAVAACSKGYPTNYSAVKGKEIFGLEDLLKDTEVKIYGAGVKQVDGKFIANGGRLFYVIGEGKNVKEAREKAYAALKTITIEGNNLHFRTDIGWRDVKRMSTSPVS